LKRHEACGVRREEKHRGLNPQVSRLKAQGSKHGFLALGSNLEDRKKNLEKAVNALHSHNSIQVLATSSFYNTAPVGNPCQGRFLNAVVEIETTLEPEELLDATLDIEKNLGRVRTGRWGPRTIDIDILALDDLVYETDRLSIPHPLMHERRFVLEPLAEIAPGFRHPVFGASAAEMLSVCMEA
jgi:2-amino-4-hydroxy-6-hydroxymethyldihydropteridine diphosphokinase